MKLRGFITLLTILIIPSFGWSETMPTTGPSYDLKTAGSCNASDLVEMALLSPVTLPGVLGQLSNTQFSAIGSQYTVQGTVTSSYSVTSVLVFALDVSGTSTVLTNPQYTDSHCPVSGTTISCTYSTGDNPTLNDTSKLLIMFSTSDSKVFLVNKTQIAKTTTSLILPDRCLDVNATDSNPIVNQLSNMQFARTTTNDLDDVYVLQASFNAFFKGTSIGQANELIAIDNATGKILTPKNINMSGEHRCTPSLTGNTANFSCQYQLKLNQITDDSPIRILVILPGSTTLFNSKLLVAKELIPDEPTPPPPQPDVVTCGENETLDNNTSACVCNDKFVMDTTTKSCVAASVSAPAMAGNSCSLDPHSAPNSQTQTILALLLMAVIAARACHYSKN